MATPYLQLHHDTVPSTQDVARNALVDLPVLVAASAQSEGRGRAGTGWENADSALAVSLAVPRDHDDLRPFSLMAGVAATRVATTYVAGAGLKWPNDVIRMGEKVGGILVEASDDALVVGLGLNLWWPDSPDGYGALFEDPPSADLHLQFSGLWGAELMAMLDAEAWPVGEYRSRCLTIGASITWDPDGSGRAVDVGADGGLVVETEAGMTVIYSGEVRHVRAG